MERMLELMDGWVSGSDVLDNLKQIQASSAGGGGGGGSEGCGFVVIVLKEWREEQSDKYYFYAHPCVLDIWENDWDVVWRIRMVQAM